ncbi:outer membrane beta-barrel protein [Olleya sp. AH-315-F22]|nr:outer membrane beta-barrel protein [Olleya sp. AH-315-F22]
MLVFTVLLFLSTFLNGYSQDQEPNFGAEPFSTANLLDQDFLFPEQTFGFGAGVGFANDFDETTFCLSAEYLRKLGSTENCGLYLGGEATYENSSFNGFKTSTFMLGPKIQYNTPITPSKQTQFVAGVMAQYEFGKIDNNGFNEDVTGIDLCLYSGFNIRVSEKWSIGAQFPILNYEKLTFKSDNGEFKADNTTLAINKNNPLKIFTRRSL